MLFAKEPRKDQSLRAVIDYRDLNPLTRRNVYPLPRIADLLQALCGAKHFTILDMTKAFNQARVRDGDEHKTAILTPFGLFESCVMELGMLNSSAHWQGLGDAIIRGDAAALPRYEIEHARYEEGERNVRRAQGIEEPALDLRDLSEFVRIYVDDVIILGPRVVVDKVIGKIQAEFKTNAPCFLEECQVPPLIK